MPRDLVVSGPWSRGINSSLPAQFLSEDHLQWSVNTINRVGATTRPGFRCLIDPVVRDEIAARGLNAFTTRLKTTYLVKIVGNTVRIALANQINMQWSTLGIIDDADTPVYFANCIKGADAGVVLPSPYPLMIIQTGFTPPFMWDGINAGYLINKEIPVGTICRWFGSRLWTAVGSKLFASDLLDPLSHTESDTLTGGGYLQFNGDITGLATTSDQQNLIVFTANQTSAIQASILDRTLWGSTVGFQRIILEDIGCIAPNSIINQYGMLWWMSQHGLIALDEALHAFRSSRLHYRDGNMARSRLNLSSDLSGIAIGAYENFLVASTPSGDTWNAHTWLMDQSPLDDITTESQPIWASCWTGIRPMQWVTVTIDGNPRIFCLSRDYKITGDDADWTVNAWECFTRNKYDLGSNADGSAVVPRRIKCSIETKYLSPKSGGYSTFGFADIMAYGLAGSSHWEAFYASSHSTYKKVLSKDIVASVDSMQSGTTLPAIVPSYLPQTRRLKTSEDVAQISDSDVGVEDAYTRNKDRGFSMLVTWEGVGGVWAIFLALDPRGDAPTGKVEDNEITDRFVTTGGISSKGDSLNLFHSLESGLTSSPITAYNARVKEDSYSSMP